MLKPIIKIFFYLIILLSYSCKKIDLDALVSTNEPNDTIMNPIDTTQNPVDTTLNNIDTIYSDSGVYFPLNIGSYWNYWQNSTTYNPQTGDDELDQFSYSDIVFSDTLINGFQYYVLRKSNSLDNFYYRIAEKGYYQLMQDSFTKEYLEVKIIDENLNSWYTNAFIEDINNNNDTTLQSFVFTKASFDYFEVSDSTYLDVLLIRRTSILWNNNFDSISVQNNTYEKSPDFIEANTDDIYYSKNIGQIYKYSSQSNSIKETLLNSYFINY